MASNESVKQTTPGRRRNAAQALGDREGLVSDKAAERTGRKSRQAAGPDGPDAGVVGETFKH